MSIEDAKNWICTEQAFEINGYQLKGGGACPEQYNVYKKDVEVGYLRLRHGRFRAECFVNGETKVVYTACPNGDGIFDDEERIAFLTQAVEAIDFELNKI